MHFLDQSVNGLQVQILTHLLSRFIFFFYLGNEIVRFDEWEKIDRKEQERGKKHGKPREKIISTKEMLQIAKE